MFQFHFYLYALEYLLTTKNVFDNLIVTKSTEYLLIYLTALVLLFNCFLMVITFYSWNAFYHSAWGPDWYLLEKGKQHLNNLGFLCLWYGNFLRMLWRIWIVSCWEKQNLYQSNRKCYWCRIPSHDQQGARTLTDGMLCIIIRLLRVVGQSECFTLLYGKKKNLLCRFSFCDFVRIRFATNWECLF